MRRLRPAACQLLEAKGEGRHGRHIRLRPVHRVKGLVEKQAGSPAVVYPRRAVLVEGRIVPQQGEEVGDDEHEPRERDQVRRHRYGEALDDHIGVERLQDVLGEQRVVDLGGRKHRQPCIDTGRRQISTPKEVATDTRVLVLLQVRQKLLPDVYHRAVCRRCDCEGRRFFSGRGRGRGRPGD